jgi:SNF2 family DNA or RNA helicase
MCTLCRQAGIPSPHLIVVPLSVLLNWEIELEKWARGGYVVALKGNEKSRRTAMDHDCYLGHADGSTRGRSTRGRPTRFDVLLTTYDFALAVRALLSCDYHRLG